MSRRRDKYELLHGQGKLHGTIKAARGKARQRAGRRRAQPTSPADNIAAIRRKHIHTIELGTATDEAVRLMELPEHRRKQRWGRAEVSSELGGYVRTQDEGHYSSGCTYHKLAYHPVVLSYGWIDRHGRLAFRHSADPLRRMKPPHGYRWDCDHNGFRLLDRNGDDYHPTMGELMAHSPRELAAKLREAAKRRRRAARDQAQADRLAKLDAKRAREAVRKAEREGAHVCLRDSLRAGNCEAGTLGWARRHGLNPARHYTPGEVQAHANGDAHRVALVVAVALRRHREEMQRGYALVADHR